MLFRDHPSHAPLSLKRPRGARSFSATLPGDSLTYLPGHSCERPAAEDRVPMPGDTLWLSDQQTKHFAPQSLGRRAAGAHVSTPEGRRSRHMPGAHHSSKGQPLCSAFTRLPLQAAPPAREPEPGPSPQRCSQSTGKVPFPVNVALPGVCAS